MSASLRRLAKDHAALRKQLPPNYLFQDENDLVSLPDDLTQLLISLTGAEGTPYSQGLWRLHLTMPIDYPKNPPKATFRTRIFHPNVEESTGAVCLETLKRDWDPKLTLKDILVTISCLLIHPNPDSALNSKAGALIQDDYEAFARQAKLMTSIHAPIPKQLKIHVDEAKRRGEDKHTASSIRKPKSEQVDVGITSCSMAVGEHKENNPSRLPSTAPIIGSSKNILGKRSLLESTPTKGDGEDQNKTSCAGGSLVLDPDSTEPPRKSPKHTHDLQTSSDSVVVSINDKENRGHDADTPTGIKSANKDTSVTLQAQNHRPTALRKISNVGSGKLRSQARVGIRRL